MKRAVLYLRVSTTEQTTANQERELREIAGRMGCEIVKVYKGSRHFGRPATNQQRSLAHLVGMGETDRFRRRHPNASTITEDILDPPIGNEPHYRDQDIDSDRQPRADKCQHDSREVEDRRYFAFNVLAQCIGKHGIRPLPSHYGLL
jgi:Resolvase, N terminal domain